MASPRHMVRRRPKLSAELKAAIDAHVLAFVSAQIHPVRLQTIAYDLGKVADKLNIAFTYEHAGRSVQRLQTDGKIARRTGPGSGWLARRSGR